MPEFTFTLATRLAEAVPATHPMRVGDAADLPAIARLYNRETARFSGIRVREPERWLGPRQGLWFGRLDAWVQVAIDADGGMVGYCIGDQVDHDAQQLHRRRASDRYRGGRLNRPGHGRRGGASPDGQDRVHVHPESRVGVYLRNLEATFSSLRPIGRSQMVRISLPGPVLEALQPYVREQAAELGSQRPSRLVIESELGSGELRLGGDLPPRQVRLPAARLSELLFGYRSADELRDIHGVELSRGDAELLDALFPPIDAYCYWPDRY